MKKSTSILLIILLGVGGVYVFANMGQHSILGNNQQGYVTKDVFSHYNNPTVKIAVVTGMHPREDLATNVVPQVIKIFALLNNVEMVDYHVTVTEQPQDFDVGRSNGQALVAQYVIPDVKNSSYQLVIIAHDHEQGYGDGYYIATPTHDVKSLSLGGSVHQVLALFNYYSGSSTNREQSSSISQVDRPITNSGTPVFVYEIPEWNNQFQAGQMTYQLFNACYKVLKLSN